MKERSFRLLKTRIKGNICTICGKRFTGQETPEEIDYSQSKNKMYHFYHSECFKGLLKK